MAERKAIEEAESKEEIEEHNGDDLEEIVVEVDEGDMLTLNIHHPPRSNEHLDLLITFHGPPTLSPNPPYPKHSKKPSVNPFRNHY